MIVYIAFEKSTRLGNRYLTAGCICDKVLSSNNRNSCTGGGCPWRARHGNRSGTANDARVNLSLQFCLADQISSFVPGLA